ncbi:MAG: undecaprenyl-diphosphate phosphatase, partial [Kiritimatiellae bacterium]|nr:undecaprenyl-diphosphate phosphatase [Kiritimatiellia bacterium]
CAQALALLPGVSRSGMTLASARTGRVDAEKAAEFSFLMSAPLIIGGVLLEILKALRGTSAAPAAAEIGWGLTIYGAALAAVVGYFSLAVLLRALKGRWFWLFGPYCLAAGLLTLILV